MTRAAAVLILSSLAVGVGAQQQPTSRTMTVVEYAAWLDALASAIEPADAEPAPLARGLPVRLRVETSRQAFDISNLWVLNLLRELQSRPVPLARSRLVERLRMVAAEASAYEAPAAPMQGSRAALDEILSRREFRNIHGPTWLDRLRQQIQQWVVRLLERVFGSSAIPTVSSILIYVLIGLAVLALAGWTYRSLKRTAALDTIVPDRGPVSAKEWSIWLAEAQQAAARGHWRNAIHLAYWCAVSFLESHGAWRPDRARTPREYLRLLPAASEHRPSLTALTRSFELVWYGTDEADARSFADALAHLEKIGCRRA
jgi:uncharacterized protein DUF4129